MPEGVSARLVREALDRAYLQQLPLITFVIGIYYGFLTAAHALFLPPDILPYLMGLAGTAAVVSFATYGLVKVGRVSAPASHMAFVPTGLLGIANVYGHVLLSGDIKQMTNGVLSLLVFGFVTLSPRVFFPLTALSVALYVYCLMSTGGADVPHYTFLLVPGLMLGVLCFAQRYSMLTRLEGLHLSGRLKNAQLEAMNQSVLAQMEEAERAAEDARRANEAKGIFLANTTHELRTPLTGVLSTMNILEHTKLDTEQKQLVSAAQVSAKTLLTLINDILDLAKLDEGKLALKPQAFDVEELVRHISGLLLPSAEEKGLSLNFEFAGGTPPRLVGDPVRIGQILLNLVGNGIKFTDEGRIDISVTTDARDSNLFHLTLSVEDTGVGFSKEEGAKLFGRFEQVDGTSRRKQGGAGLGLAICRELAALMDGSLSAESKPGVGSRFTFAVTLPKAEGKYDPTPKAVDQSAAMSALKLRVLLAEDNKINQMLIEKLLNRYGWAITVVSNGEDAVRETLTGAYDLVLMDVRMPVKDGVTAVQEVRSADEDIRSTPIIALTANTMVEDIESYMAAGMDKVVGKPIDIAELETAVLDLFAGRGTDGN